MTPDPGPVLDLALAGPPLLHNSRLVCIDGPAGSGKTTLGDLVVTEAHRRGLSTALVHMDDVFEGWDGLATAGERIHRWVVEPLGRGRSGDYPRYDWHRARYAEHHVVQAADIVVIEGVGSASARFADRIGVLAWVEAPAELRLRRGLDRDGPELQPHWRRWAAAEQELYERERTRERADLLVDGATGRLRVARPAGRPQHERR